MSTASVSPEEGSESEALMDEIQSLREENATLLARLKEQEVRADETLYNLEVHQEELRVQNEELSQSREALELALQKYSSLFESGPLGYLLIDQNTQIADINVMGTSMLGHTRRYLAQKPLMLYVDAASRPVLEHHFRTVFAGNAATDEVRFNHKERGRYPVILESRPLDSLPGGERRCLTAAFDISRRKQVEEALRDSESRYRSLVEHMHDGLFVVEDGVIAFANPAAGTMLGHPGEALLGRPLAAIMDARDLQKLEEHWRHREDGADVPAPDEVTLRHGDGISRVYAHLSDAVITQANGRRAQLITIKDISARREMEEALRQEHKFLEALLANVGTAVAVLDREGRIQRFNPAMESLSGYREREVLGQRLEDSMITGDAGAELVRAREAVVGGAGERWFQSRMGTRGGEARRLACSVSEVPGADGRVAHVMVAAMDVTDRERAMAEFSARSKTNR